MKAAAILVSVCSGLALVACGPGLRGDDDGGDDGATTDAGGTTTDQPRQCNKMDIVFVVDDSGSMQEEQSNLATNFPMFANLLSSYTDARRRSSIDYRVAVTTTGKDLDYTDRLRRHPAAVPQTRRRRRRVPQQLQRLEALARATATRTWQQTLALPRERRHRRPVVSRCRS